MLAIIVSLCLPALPGDDPPPAEVLPALVAKIGTLLEPVGDFRCEFEGTMHFRGPVAQREGVGGDGLADMFAGVLLWNKGGDVRAEILHLVFPGGGLERESLAVRGRGPVVDYLRRSAVLPRGAILLTQHDPEVMNSVSVLGQLFYAPLLNNLASDGRRTVTVSDGEHDGHPMKLLTIGLEGVPGLVMGRLWIDMQRNGHVVRGESYLSGKLAGRLDIKLDRFRVGDSEVWMPVSAVASSFAAIENGVPVTTEEPTVVTTLRIRRNSLKFNARPAPETYTFGYTPEVPAPTVPLDR